MLTEVVEMEPDTAEVVAEEEVSWVEREDEKSYQVDVASQESG